MNRHPIAIMTAALVLVGLGLQGASAQAPDDCGTDDGTGCAPLDSRVDLQPPTFSDPLDVTNPLHPSSSVRSGLMLGYEEGVPLRVEITLLPEPHVIELDGHSVPALESQYVAFLDGRIHEVALDWYAQADDGAVWYLGEDVFNYEDGVVADTEGTWEAGRDAPPAMIMPAVPQVGDVYRPENAPGVVFEEVTVTRTALEVDGPSGPVAGAIEVDELHMDGGHESKVFAPGYGEFTTGAGRDLEALALAVPTDALAGSVPPGLAAVGTQAAAIGAAAVEDDRAAATSSLAELEGSWEAVRATSVPPMLEAAMDEAVAGLSGAVEAWRPRAIRSAAIEVARLGLDLELRHRDPASVDADRFTLWLRQLVLDLDRSDQPAGLGDVTALEWTRDRFAHTLDSDTVTALDAALDELRTAADRDDRTGTGRSARSLERLMQGIG